MKELNIDFDGVILDTINPLYQKLQEDNIPEDKIKDFFINYDWTKIIKDQYIINDSIDCIQKIIDSNKFNLAILTHVNSLHEAELKIKYLRKYFKDITIIPCPKAISKTKMVHTKDSILVDDYAGNLREWEKEGGIPVRFSQKMNGKGFKVVDKLDQLIEMF